MAQLSPAAQHLMEYFGAIQGAVSSRASTAEVWDALRTQSAATGRPIPAGAFLAVNELRSIAVGLRSASEELNSAGGVGSLQSNMIGAAPYARSEAAQLAQPAWEVKFLHTMLVDGLETATWATTYFYGSLPATLEELQNAVAADATLMSTHYGAEASLGVSNLSIAAF